MKRIDSILIISITVLLIMFSCKKTEQEQKSIFQLLTSKSWGAQQILNSPSIINSRYMPAMPSSETYYFSPDGNYTHENYLIPIQEEGVWVWKSQDREIILKLYKESALLKTIYISIIDINDNLLHTIQHEEGQAPSNYIEIKQYSLPK